MKTRLNMNKIAARLGAERRGKVSSTVFEQALPREAEALFVPRSALDDLKTTLGEPICHCDAYAREGKMRPAKIISGGQTGADMGGLLAARDLGIPTGGWAPKGWRTEAGPNPDLKAFDLQEHSSSNYADRTAANVLEADLTLLFGNRFSPGSRLTISLCNKLERAYLLVANDDGHAIEAIRGVDCQLKPLVINVAGNRESRAPGIQERVRRILREVWQDDEMPLVGATPTQPKTERR